MAAEQDILSISFDYKRTDAEGKRVLATLLAVNDAAEKLENKQVSLGSVAGAGDLKAIQKEIQQGYKDISASILKFNTAIAQNSNTVKNSNSTLLANAKAATEASKQTEINTKTTILNNKENDRAAKLAAQKANAITVASAKEAKAAADLSSEYRRLTIAYNAALNRSRDLQLTSPNSPTTKAATAEAAALKERIRTVDLAAGNTSTSVGRYKKDIIEASEATNGFGKSVGKAYGFVRVLANILPGLGISGIFLLGYEAIKSVIVGLGVMGKQVTDVDEKTKRLNETYLETEGILKDINNLTAAPSANLESLEKQIDLIKAGNKSRLEQLNLERDILKENQKQAQIKYENLGGGFEFARLSGALAGAEKRYTDFLKRRATIKADYDKEELDTEQEQLKLSFDIAKNEYEKGRKILDDRLKYDKESAAKDLEIQTYFAEQKRKVILNNAKNSADDTIKANERVLNNEKSTLQERLKALENTAAARKKVALAELNDVRNDPSTENSAARTNAIKNYYKAIKDLTKAELAEESKLKEDYRRRDVTAQLNSQKQTIEARKAIEKDFFDNSDLTLQERLKLAAAYANDQQELSLKQYNVDKDFAIATGKTDKELFDLEVGYNLKLAQITAETQSNITSILKAEISKRKKAQDDYFEDINLASSFINADAAEKLLGDTQKISSKYRAGKLTYEKYQKELAKVNSTYQAEQDKTTLEGLKKQLDYYNEFYPDILDKIKETEADIKNTRALAQSDATAEVKRQALARLDVLEAELKAQKKVADEIAKARKAIAESGTSITTKGDGNKKTEEEEKLKAIVKVLEQVQYFEQQFADVIGGAIDASITKRLNALQAIEDKQQENYENEVERISNSTLSQTQQAEALHILEAKRRAEKQQFDRKVKDEELRKAKFDKAQAIASIILNTAVAVAKVAAIPVLAAITAALGAAQLLIAIQTPLPKYAKGVQDKPTDGFAMAGEEYKPERINIPGQKPFIVDTPTVLYMPQHTSVTPLGGKEILYNTITQNTKEVLQTSAQQKAVQQSMADELLHDIRSGIDKLAKRPVNVHMGQAFEFFKQDEARKARHRNDMENWFRRK